MFGPAVVAGPVVAVVTVLVPAYSAAVDDLAESSMSVCRHSVRTYRAAYSDHDIVNILVAAVDDASEDVEDRTYCADHLYFRVADDRWKDVHRMDVLERADDQSVAEDRHFHYSHRRHPAIYFFVHSFRQRYRRYLHDNFVTHFYFQHHFASFSIHLMYFHWIEYRLRFQFVVAPFYTKKKYAAALLFTERLHLLFSFGANTQCNIQNSTNTFLGPPSVAFSDFCFEKIHKIRHHFVGWYTTHTKKNAKLESWLLNQHPTEYKMLFERVSNVRNT